MRKEHETTRDDELRPVEANPLGREVNLSEFSEEWINFRDAGGDKCVIRSDKEILIISNDDEYGVAFDESLARSLIVTVKAWLENGSLMDQPKPPLIKAPDPPGSDFAQRCRKAVDDLLGDAPEDALGGAPEEKTGGAK